MGTPALAQRTESRAGARCSVAGVLFSVLHGICVAALILPPCRVVAATAPSLEPPPAAIDAVPTDDVAIDISPLERAFGREAESLGLHPIANPQVERIGADLIAVKATAAVPLDRRTTSTFFLQRTLIVSQRSDLLNEVVAQTDFTVRYAGDHVTLEYADRFSTAFDALARRETGLAGIEIRRMAEFDSPGLESYAAAQLQARSAGQGGGLMSPPSQVAEQIEADNYVETATIVLPDGTERTYPAGQLDLSRIFGGQGGGADLTIGCLSDCFSATGGTIGLVTAACLVAGLVVCVAACAVSAGIACIPCIGAGGMHRPLHQSAVRSSAADGNEHAATDSHADADPVPRGLQRRRDRYSERAGARRQRGAWHPLARQLPRL